MLNRVILIGRLVRDPELEFFNKKRSHAGSVFN